MTTRGWIGVDLDGTLAHYDGWRGELHVGAAIQPMLDRVKRWLADGKYDVRIFTARVSDPEEAVSVTARIHEWCEENGLPKLIVTNVKDYAMVELWDDRAVQVIANTGEPVGESTRGLT
jgi:hypothetical protein